MANVYSTRFLQEVGLVGAAGYVIPAGFVGVVRDLDAYVAAPLLTSTDLFLVGAGGQKLAWWTTDADTTTTPEWRGRQVFAAGETVTVVSTGSVDVTVSGYLLTAP